MRQLSKALETPEVQERLLTIERGYSLHNAAQFILKAKGVQSSGCCYFQGNSYRIEERGSTLTIWHQQQEQPIYQAVDGIMGSIVAINQRNFSEQDLENFSAYARYLKQGMEQQLQRSRQRERGFGIGD